MSSIGSRSVANFVLKIFFKVGIYYLQYLATKVPCKPNPMIAFAKVYLDFLKGEKYLVSVLANE